MVSIDSGLHYIDIISGRAVATPYLGMTLVFLGFGRFQVSETAIKQTHNFKLMREMQSSGQTDPTESIRCLQMCPRVQGHISEKPHIFLSSSFFIHVPSGHNVALKRSIHTPNNSLFPGIETFDTLFLF